MLRAGAFRVIYTPQLQGIEPMLTFQKGQMQPLMAIALGSVIIASGVVVARQAGWIGSHAAPDQVVTTATDGQNSPSTTPPRAEHEGERYHAPRLADRRGREYPHQSGSAGPAGYSGPAPSNAPPCPDCGVVTSIHEVQIAGNDSGLGAVAGGVAGGVIGHQIGNGNGRTVATVLGALGGAFAGNTVEKHERQRTEWKISVRSEDGNEHVFTSPTAPSLSPGEPVRVQGGQIIPR